MAGLGGLIGGLAANLLFPGAGLLGTAAGAIGGALLEEQLFNPEDRGAKDLEEKMAKWNEGPASAEDALENLFKSRFTIDGVSPHFSTAEERDAYDRSVMEKYGGQPVVAKPYEGLAKGGMAESGIGGLIRGPGTVTSDSIPGGIMQNGRKVDEILVSNGEVIMSGKDLAALDPDGNAKRAGMRLGGAANGSRGAEAARMFAEVQKMRKG